MYIKYIRIRYYISTGRAPVVLDTYEQTPASNTDTGRVSTS